MRSLQSRLLKGEPPVSPTGAGAAANGQAAAPERQALGPQQAQQQHQQAPQRRRRQQPVVPTDGPAEGQVDSSPPEAKAGSSMSSMQVSPQPSAPQQRPDGRQQQRAGPPPSPLQDTGCSSMQTSPPALA